MRVICRGGTDLTAGLREVCKEASWPQLGRHSPGIYAVKGSFSNGSHHPELAPPRPPGRR